MNLRNLARCLLRGHKTAGLATRYVAQGGRFFAASEEPCSRCGKMLVVVLEPRGEDRPVKITYRPSRRTA